MLTQHSYANEPLPWLLTPSASFTEAEADRLFSELAIEDRHIHRVKAGKRRTTRFIRIEHFHLETIRALEESGLFSTVEVDSWGELASCALVNDNGYSLQWGLENDGTIAAGAVVGADIDACAAWEIAQGNDSIIVGFVDSGTKIGHADLIGRQKENEADIPNNNIDDDSNGYVDDVHGWNTANNTNDIADNIGHGVQVNGIVGANSNNTLGFAGLDWHCQLMNVRGVNPQGQGLLSWWAEGVYYLVDNGAHIINMSVTGYSSVQVLQDAVEYADSMGVLVVAAVGNDNQNSIGYPAKYPTVIGVGATNFADQRAVWSGGAQGSNYGPEVDVVAPGMLIYGLNHMDNGLWYVTAGTSQATPLVSGMASLILGYYPELSIQEVREIIRATAEDEVGLNFEDVEGFDEHHGYGRINAFFALDSVQNIINALNVSNTETNQKDFNVFPNPTQDNITITVKVDKAEASLFSAEGRWIAESELHKGNNQLEIPRTPGIYILRIQSDQKLITKRIIKQ